MDDFDLEGALSRYPLPDGVEDQPLTLNELAKALDLTEPTIKRYIDAGMPVEQQGGHGRGYELRLSACYAWKKWRDRADADRRAKAQASIDQLRLEFRGDEDAAPEGMRALSAKEIAEESTAELARLKAAQARGDLIPTERVRSTVERTIVGFRNGMVSLPDFAEIELGLSPSDVDKLQGWVDQRLDGLETELSEILQPAGDVQSMKSHRGT